MTLRVLSGIVAALICVSLQGPLHGATSPSTWQTLQDRLFDRYLDAGPPAAEVGQVLSVMDEDGQFTDLDYEDTPLADFRDHLSRVSLLFTAYYRSGTVYHGDADIFAAGAVALEWWLREDYRDPNWWHTYIGFPARLARVTPIAGRDLRADFPEVYTLLIAYHRRVLDYLRGNPMGGGANLSDMGYFSLLGAVVDEDEAWVRALIAESFDPAIRVLGKDDEFEGWQVDASMHAHGPQLHNATYGYALMNSATRAVRLLFGTAFDLGEEVVELLQWQLLEGVQRMTYGNWFDYNATGRGISRPSSPRFASGFANIVPFILEMDPSRPEALQAFRERVLNGGPTPGNTFHGAQAFYRSDFLTRVQRNAYTSVRMVSNRTIRNEMGNDEGRKNRYFGDGVHLTLIHGDEYDTAPVLWDYARIPGVTARQVSNLRPNNIWGERGRASYAGSLTNGNRGLAAMVKDFDGMRGRKSWFLTRGGTVALGSGIGVVHPSLRDDVFTSVNQTQYEGGVWIVPAGEDGEEVALPFERDLEGEAVVWHRGIGYYFFPENGTIRVKASTVSANWSEVGVSEGEVTGDMFSLYLDHGSIPQDAGYAYMISPWVSPAGAHAVLDQPPVEILSRDSMVHAVEEVRCGTIYAAFWEAGELVVDERRSISVDGPALVMVSETLGEWSLMAADPEQAAETLTVTVTGWSMGGSGFERLGEDPYQFDLDLPQGDHTGAAVRVSAPIPDYPLYSFGETEVSPEGWMRADRWGPYKPGDGGWAYHADLGWVLMRSDDADDIFVYDPRRETWLWTRSDLPAWAYDLQAEVWIQWK